MEGIVNKEAINIRPETKNDYKKVYSINQQAFQNEFEPNLVEAIRKSSNYIPELSLVAINEKQIVGYCLLSKINIKTKNQTIPALALAPVAVGPEYQNQGVGSSLVNEAIKQAKILGHKAIIVLGHPNYYQRFGFIPASTKGIKPTFDVPDEAFMLLELEPGALEAGEVIYPPEFGV